jgi:hypothetical protein
MTSLHHDDSIEIITSSTPVAFVQQPAVATSSSAGHVPGGRPAHVIDIGLTLVSAASGVVHPVGLVGPSAPLTGRYFRRKFTTTLSAKASAKEKRIKKAVMIVASLMILASMVLVGVSLSMSEHIDEMGKKPDVLFTAINRCHCHVHVVVMSSYLMMG